MRRGSLAPEAPPISFPRLIEKQIESSGKCPVTGEELSKEDLVEVKGNKAIRPKPATATSIPGMLSGPLRALFLAIDDLRTLLQSEWVRELTGRRALISEDALMSETYELKSQLDTSGRRAVKLWVLTVLTAWI